MRQVQHLNEALQEMHNDGITRKELENRYHLTEWGSRKFVDVLPTTEEKLDRTGRPKKYTLEKAPTELDRETLHEQVPVELNNTELTREDQHDQAKKTQEARSYLERLESTVKSVEPATVEYDEEPETQTDGADLVLHDTDLHIGGLVENRHGEIVFDAHEAKHRQNSKVTDFMTYAYRRDDRLFGGVDTIHWFLGGDIVEGTGIYSGQAHELDLYINEQLELATEILTNQLKRLTDVAADLDADLQIVTVPGNHGNLKISGASNSANFDDLVYFNLQHATDIHLESLDEEDTPNVRFKRSDNTVGVTAPLRGGRYTAYLTHGQHMKQHVGTSSGQKDALSIMREYDSDIIFRGHYHMPKVEDVNGVPVVMTNSLKPAGDHEDTLQAYGDAGYAMYTVTDQEVLEDATFKTF